MTLPVAKPADPPITAPTLDATPHPAKPPITAPEVPSARLS